MKKTFALIFVVLLYANVAFAQVSATFGGTTTYVGPNDGLTYDKDPAITASIDFASESGWYVGAWQSFDFDGKKDFGDETNFYIGGDTSIAGLDLNAQATYYVLTGGSDAANFSGTVSKTFGKVTPYVSITHDAPIDGNEYPSGEIYRAGAGVALLKSPKWTIDADVAVFYDDGPYGNPKGTSATLGVTAGYAAGQSTFLSLEARTFRPLSAEKDIATFAGISVTRTVG